MYYGPKLTPAQYRKLREEIAAFDEKATRAEIEKAANGGRAIDAYQEWVDERSGNEPIEANPDHLTDEVPQPWGQVKQSDTTGLSALERDAWELCKEMGHTREDAAKELGVTPNAIRTALARARQKLKGQL
jgi:DNA-directed RNA polymerase specialized sigma24 family protein